MFSRKTLMIFGLVCLIAGNLIFIAVINRDAPKSFGAPFFYFLSPLQKVVTESGSFLKDVWRHYFMLITAAKENDRLKKELADAKRLLFEAEEIRLENERLRSLLNFRATLTSGFIAAEVIGRDPSPYIKTLMIDKGEASGIDKGAAVVTSEGIVGQVIETTTDYSKVLCAIDRNSALDGLVQRTRTRGVVKGGENSEMVMGYVLRAKDVRPGDIVISSGQDGVFPKGLRIGTVAETRKKPAEPFQDVRIRPFVDFERLEEVLVLID